jgi:Ankyrin repeats (3 copies)
MRLLLTNEADTGAPGPAGRTALHVAISRGSTEAADLLLGAGADINAQCAPAGAVQQYSARALPVPFELAHTETPHTHIAMCARMHLQCAGMTPVSHH